MINQKFENLPTHLQDKCNSFKYTNDYLAYTIPFSGKIPEDTIFLEPIPISFFIDELDN